MNDQTALITHMLQLLETPNRELTKWEEEFLDNIRDRHGAGKALTEAQFDVLDRLYAEKTA